MKNAALRAGGLSLVVLIIAFGCEKSPVKLQQEEDRSDLVSQFLQHLKPKVPAGWTLHDPTYGSSQPHGWENGRGSYILVYNDAAPAVLGKRAPWTDVHIWIMNGDYSVGMPVGTGRGTAQEIATLNRQRVFITGAGAGRGANPWPKNGILAALIASGAQVIEQPPIDQNE
jgi:hypothetical protein